MDWATLVASLLRKGCTGWATNSWHSELEPALPRCCSIKAGPASPIHLAQSEASDRAALLSGLPPFSYGHSGGLYPSSIHCMTRQAMGFGGLAPLSSSHRRTVRGSTLRILPSWAVERPSNCRACLNSAGVMFCTFENPGFVTHTLCLRQSGGLLGVVAQPVFNRRDWLAARARGQKSGLFGCNGHLLVSVHGGLHCPC